VPIDINQASDITKASYIYRKEKELIYSSLFLVGRIKTPEPVTPYICAPLLVYPAAIVESDSAAYITIDPSERQLNYRLIECLQDGNDGLRLAQRLAEILGADPLTYDRVTAIGRFLESALPGLTPRSLAGIRTS
jgi:hypothetical protein